MAESSLSIGYADLLKEVGRFVGYGDGGSLGADWTADQLDEVQGIIRSGTRQFYHPPPLRPGEKIHQWSFLRPVTTQVTVASTATYTLPDNFGALIGNLTFATADSGYQSIKVVSEDFIRKLNQGSGTAVTGAPVYAAVRPASTAESTGQRFTLVLYPSPNAVYTLSYRYAILKNDLDSTDAYPMGGEAHAETILESCLACAEQRLDDEAGLHTQKFMERLAASVAFDKQFEPAFYGYNGDRSGPGSSGKYGNDLVCLVNGTDPT